MSIILIYIIISFLLDGLISNYASNYFITIYSVVSLVVVFNYFDNKSKYLYLLLSLGILFDIVYTDTLLLNVFAFFLVYVFLESLNYFIPNNLFTINIKAIISIFIYYIATSLLLMLSNYDIYPIKIILLVLLKNIIMTIIYTSISYLILRKIFYNKYDKKIK